MMSFVRVFSCLLLIIPCCVFAQTQDSLIYAEGKILNGETREPVKARITYQSLPYGNKIGTINNTSYSFPMFDGEKYAIMVEADGFAPAKYILDPAQADASFKVIKDIELGGKEKEPEHHNVGQVLRLNNLIFEVGKSRIDPESYGELDALLNMMMQNPKMIIQLEGHTDYLGNAKENMKLSLQRVESVREYLIGKGISKIRIKTKAFGGTQPLSKEDTPEAHRLNRRVEVRILQD